MPLKNFIAYNSENIFLWKSALLELNEQIKQGERKLSAESERLKEREQQLQNRTAISFQPINQNDINWYLRLLTHHNEKVSHCNKLKLTAIELENKIKDAEIFLHTLQDEPENLTRKLAQDVKNTLVHYKKITPVTDLSLIALLFKIDEKIDAVLANQNQSTNDAVIYAWQKKYMILCGFVWSFIEEHLQADFEALLSTLIPNLHLKNNDTLPNFEKTVTCKKIFTEFKAEHKELFCPRVKDVYQEQQKIFAMALSDLRTMIIKDDKQNMLHQYALQLADVLEKEIGESFNDVQLKKMTSFTHYLHIAKHTIQDPIANSGGVMMLWRQEMGSPTHSSKAASALLAMAGAAFVVAGMTVLAVSCGSLNAIAEETYQFGLDLIDQSKNLKKYVGMSALQRENFFRPVYHSRVGQVIHQFGEVEQQLYPKKSKKV